MSEYCTCSASDGCASPRKRFLPCCLLSVTKSCSYESHLLFGIGTAACAVCNPRSAPPAAYCMPFGWPAAGESGASEGGMAQSYAAGAKALENVSRVTPHTHFSPWQHRPSFINCSLRAVASLLLVKIPDHSRHRLVQGLTLSPIPAGHGVRVLIL